MALIEIDWHPDRRSLRGFGLAAVAAFAAVGGWVHFRHSLFWCPLAEPTAEVTACVLCTLALLCGAAALAWPPALRPLYRGLSLVGAPIGWLVSLAILAAVFYLVLTPIGLVMRLFGRDPLQRRFDRSAPTYWVPRRAALRPERYFRQF
jgi:hypothetical protein